VRSDVIEAYLNSIPKMRINVPHGVNKATECKPNKPDVYTTLVDMDSRAYPLVTFTDGYDVRNLEIQGPVRRIEVKFNRIDGAQIVDVLNTILTNGGVAGIVVNTVKRAQAMYSQLQEAFGNNVCLLHSRFMSSERAKLEKDLVSSLGPGDSAFIRPDKMIVVGTQIFEQSMDIDFDVLITDLCPMDMLLQRVGRLHRHIRVRPNTLVNAVCYVMGASWGGFDRGSELIYGRYLLMRTLAVMPEYAILPGDISNLVADVYEDDREVGIPVEMVDEYKASKEAWLQLTDRLVGRANAFQISPPQVKSLLIGWLDTTASDAQGNAAVRDGPDSLEVIVIQRIEEELFFLPWIENGQALLRTMPDEDLARKLLGCTIRLPAMFGEEWMIDNAIKELEERMITEGLSKGWYLSHWLKGMLVMILDENREITLCGHLLKYEKELGLCMDP